MSWTLLGHAEKVLALEAIAHGDPNVTGALLDDALGEARASVLDVHFFGGVRTVLTFEAPREELTHLVALLARARVVLDDASRAAIERASGASGDDSVAGMLSITFAHGDPDQKHEVPAVPG